MRSAAVAARVRLRPSVGAALAAVSVAMLTLTSGGTSSDASDKRQSAGKETLRLGYFANITHAPTLIAAGKGFVARELGSVTLETQAFNARPAAIEAVGGDIGYGLGALLQQGRELADMSLVMLAILLILVVGIAVELLAFAPVERKVLRGRGLVAETA